MNGFTVTQLTGPFSNTEARKDPAFVQNRLVGTPGNRWGEPLDFAGPAVFLASAASNYVSGETLVVDGVSDRPLVT